MNEDSIDDQLDELVARYSDAVENGEPAPREKYLREVPPEMRPALERCLKMIEAGNARTPTIAQPLRAGLQLDHYTLMREVGRGGMALVWLARDEKLNRSVALKILRPGLALEERNAERFRREALAVASLRHPNILQIFGASEAFGYHYLAMEFIEGPSLATVLEALPRDRAPSAEALARATGNASLATHGDHYERAVATLMAPVVEALEAAHGKGLVHRDIKPSNILLRADGSPVLADFGLAKGDEDPTLSLTGAPIGTPFYMSPEQAYVTGTKRIDHRTDVYSMGVTLFEALCGVRPFSGDSFLEVIESIRSTIPPSVRTINRNLSKNAAAVVAQAMRRDPEERYESAADLYEDLVALSAGRPTDALGRMGSPLRRLWLQIRIMSSGINYEYRSARTFLGLPLVHVYSGRRHPGQPWRVAKAWFAMGDMAIGGVAAGAISAGGLCFGGLSAGVIAWAGIGVGGFVWSGIGVGLIAFSGIAVGLLAIGGIAYGYAALGGMSYGKYVAGGRPVGEHVWDDRAQNPDPEAARFFQETLPQFFGF